ncbi:MAG: D-glycero-beta-D-manno-heptose-7-phosphate kinase [Clostridiales bacterium]|nr:D-glycero-beta-D-manno-heptose-7-phosphate kinase [Clostridiales bacterium]
MTKAFDQLKMLVVGDLMIDIYLKGEVSRISPEAPVPVMLVKEQEYRLGGAGNVINNILALGGKVSCLSCIGSDGHGDWLKKQLNDKNVDTGYLFRTDDRPTITKTRVTAQNQQLLRYDEEVHEPVPQQVYQAVSQHTAEIMKGVDGVIISDYGKGMITADMARCVITQARKEHIPVFVDPKGTDYAKYAGATVCTPNFKEFSEAVGRKPGTEEEIMQDGIRLCEKNAFDYVLLTRSEKGMSLIDGKNRTKEDFPAVAKEVVDVTGAGDTSISMFSLAFTAGYPLPECCRLANIAASVVVSRFGAAAATIEEVRRNMDTDAGDSKKIVSVEEAIQWREKMKAQGKKVVFTNGCFDLVHAGHISSFRQARAFGDKLIVALNSDASVRRLKGPARPVVDQENRLRLLAAIELIDKLVLFEDDTPEDIIRAICPDVLVKGKDWEGKEVAGGRFVTAHGGELRFIDMEEGLSTTNLISRILQSVKEQ